MFNLRILVIEDDPDWQDIVSRTLRPALGEGLQIDFEIDYEDGLKAIQNTDYDLISVDLELPANVEDLVKPDLAGMMLLREIRKNPRSADSGLLILTGHPTVKRVREALRSYKVYDFFDKVSFASEQGDYTDAAKTAVRGALLDRAATRENGRYKFFVTYEQNRFLQGELTGPAGLRALYKIESSSEVAFADLSRRADELNTTLAYGELGKWRVEARSIGEALYKAFIDQVPLLEGLTAARALTSKQPSNLSLQFGGPSNGLNFPFELMRTANEYLAMEHVITRRIEGKPGFVRGAQAFLKLVASIVKAGETLRILIVSANSSGNIPASEEEAEALAKSIESSLSVLGVSHYVTWLGGEDSTCERVKEELRSGYHIFHYAGHAAFDDSLPERSAIRLCDGILTASDLKMTSRETDLHLVFLSCCFGAKNSSLGGRGDFSGFLDALSQAGVPVAIGYRWEVVDDSAQRLAIDFYSVLFRDFCPGRALMRARQNCTTTSDQRRDDATWASPVLLMDC